MNEKGNRQVWAVMPAAGSSQRFETDLPKQYHDLAGEPLLLATLRRVAGHPQVAGVVVVLAPDDARWPGLASCMDKPVVTAPGGRLREASVRAGLAALPDSVRGDDWVLVHDAARPCVRHEDISRLLDYAADHPVGGVLGVPVRDTLKTRDNDGHVSGTVDRESLWHAQTPQMFRRAELAQALEKAGPVTDESAAMEACGRMPLLVQGSSDNIKVTYPEDLALAAHYLRVQSGESRCA